MQCPLTGGSIFSIYYIYHLCKALPYTTFFRLVVCDSALQDIPENISVPTEPHSIEIFTKEFKK